MKKFNWRFAGVLALALVMVLTSTGCSIIKGFFAKDVTGAYNTDISIDQFMDDEDMAPYEQYGIDYSDFKMRINLTMNEDKTFEFKVDEQAVKDSFSQLVNNNLNAILDAALDEAGMSDATDSQKDMIAKAAGYDDWEDFGEDLAEQVEEAFDEELEGQFDEITTTGTYEVDGDTVKFTGTNGSGSGMDQATIGKDGSLSINYSYKDKNMTMIFIKKSTNQ